MTQPSLNPVEVAAVLRGNVERLISLGLSRETATRAVALDHGVDSAFVADFVSRFYPAELAREEVDHG